MIPRSRASIPIPIPCMRATSRGRIQKPTDVRAKHYNSTRFARTGELYAASSSTREQFVRLLRLSHSACTGTSVGPAPKHAVISRVHKCTSRAYMQHCRILLAMLRFMLILLFFLPDPRFAPQQNPRHPVLLLSCASPVHTALPWPRARIPVNIVLCA